MDDPKQLLENQQKKSAPLMGSLDLFDFNILPQRLRRRKIRLAGVLPWLVFILLLGALYPSGGLTLQAQAVFQNSKDQLEAVQTSLENYQSAAVEMESLQSEIDLETEKRDQIFLAYQGLDMQGLSWSSILYQIESVSPDGIAWTLLTIQEDQIQLEGIADNYQTILSLEDALDTIEELFSIRIERADQVVQDQPIVIADPLSEDNLSSAPPDTPYTFTLLAHAVQEGLR